MQTTSPVYQTHPTTVVSTPIRTASVSWGAIFAGALVAVGVWMLLHLLGMGIGMTALNPDDAGSLRGVGIGTGIWTIVAPIIALFIGGLATGRMAGPMSGVSGAIHGTVMWSLASVAAVFMLYLTVSAVIQGTRAGAGIASAAANATTTGQVDATQRDAEQVASSANQRLTQGTSQLGDMAQRAQHTALSAAEDAGKVLIGLFGAMALGLAASITGAAVGVSRARKRARALATDVGTTHAAAH